MRRDPAGARAAADAVERAVLARITPDPSAVARLATAREHLIEKARAEAAARNGPTVRCLVAGSAARNTFLPDRLDIDLFLLYPPTVDRRTLESEGLALAGALLDRPETRYAEHPYLRGQFEGFSVDAVPGYAIDDPSHPMSAVDRTPFHQRYLEEHSDARTPGEVRLAKQFLRSAGVYGSEAKTGGFSGYLVELLILKAGGFRPLLESATDWRLPVRLSHDPSARPVVPEDVALILDDPVDPHRNVATALTRANLARFILAAGDYLERPDERFFHVPPAPALPLAEALERVRRRGTHVAQLRLARPRLVDDILYPQLRKAERALAASAKRLGFTVLGSASAAGPDALLVLLEVSASHLPSVEVHNGPPVGIDRSKEFLSKWTREGAPVLQGPYVTEDGRLAVDLERSVTALEPLLTRELLGLPLGRDLRELVGPATSVEPIEAASDSPELSRALSDLLDKRGPAALPTAVRGSGTG